MYECDSLICIATEILDCWHDGVGSSLCLGWGGIVLRNNCVSATLTAFDFVATSWLILTN